MQTIRSVPRDGIGDPSIRIGENVCEDDRVKPEIAE
jgi:hypothetical protein